MIEGYCRTNLDNCKNKKWPTQFVSVPKEGDRVQAEDGTRLKVYTITHIMIKKDAFDSHSDCRYVPGIEIELHR